MLMGFFIVVSINSRIIIVFNGSQILLNYELLPNLNNLIIEVLRLLYLRFLSEYLSHIVVTTAQIDTLWSIECRL